MRTKKVFPVGESSHRLSGSVGESSRRPRGQVSHAPARKVVTKKTGKKVPRGMKMPRGKKVPRGMKVPRGKKVVKELRDGENYLTPAAVADIVRRLNSGEEALFPNIHNADVYSKHPKDLVEEFARAVWINGHEDEVSIWLFRGKKVRCRAVGEKQGRWYQEDGKTILDAEGNTITWASRKQFSYTINCTSTNQRGERTGWVMAEFSLTKQEEGTDLICVVYQSNRCYQETPTEDNSSPEEKTPSIEQGHNEAEEEDGETVDASLGFPGAFSDTDPASITSLLVQAAEKATNCRESCKMACEIDEFVVVKNRCLRIIDELRLDGSIISSKLYELEVLLQGVALAKKLIPEACANIVSHGKHLAAIIVSATLDKYAKRTGQALNVFEGIIGVNVYDQVLETASQVMNVSLVVRDSAGKKYERVLYQAPAEDGVLPIVEGAENECPIPVNTSAASRSGLKRKADQDHPEGPPSTRRERADTDIDGQDETNPVPFSENDPMPAGGDCVRDLAYSVINGEPQVQPEQQGLTEVTEGGDGPCNALELEELVRNLLPQDDPMQNGGDNGEALDASAYEVQPEQQGLTEVKEGGGGPSNTLEELVRNLFPEDDPMQDEGDNGEALDASAFEVQPEQQGLTEVTEGGGGPCNALEEQVCNLLPQEDPMQDGGDIGEALDASAFEVQPEQQGHTEVTEGGSEPCNAVDELERNLFFQVDPMQGFGTCNGQYEIDGFFNSDDPMHARGDDGGDLAFGVTTGEPEVQPEQQGPAEVAEGGIGPGNGLAGGDSGGDSVWAWLIAVILDGNDNLNNTGGQPIIVDNRIGEPAWPQSAPGAVTEVDVGQGSCTGPGCPEETAHQLSPDNDLMAVGDPGELMEDFPGQFEAEKYTQRPIDLDVGWHWVSATDAEPEYLANKLLGPSHGDMSGGRDGVEFVSD